MNAKRLLPRRRSARTATSSITQLGAMFGLDDADAIAAELRSRGVRYRLSASGIYANAADVLATFDPQNSDMPT